MRAWLGWMVLALFALTTDAQDYHGFARTDFEFEGVGAILVEPERAAMGQPWIWRARFFGHEPQTDIALLEAGFHLAYVDVAGLYGNALAVERWRAFHDFLVREHSLSRRPAIEAMSRGGLIALEFAKRYPDRVSCLYLDAPVCDLRSWPGGFGAGRGSANDWRAACAAWGRSEDEMLALEAQAFAQLEPLVEHGVGLLSVVGQADQVVPVAENTDVLLERFEAIGGSIEVIRKPDIGHHPHSLEDPTPIVDFVLEHAFDPAHWTLLRAGLPRFAARVRAGESVRVAYLGGSITAMSGWRESVSAGLRERWPDVEWSFVEAGIPSLDSSCHAARLERDVLAHGPVDLLLVEAAVNDLHNGRDAVRRRRGMEGVVRGFLEAHAERGAEVALMHFIDPSMFAQYEAGEQPPTIASHEEVARHYGLPSLHLAREVHERIGAGQFTWADDFRNLHPSPFGHALYTRSILRLLERAVHEAEASAQGARELPDALDAHSYDRGRLLDLEAAELGEGFTLIERWRPSDGAGTRAGYVDVRVLEASEPGARLALEFEGRAVGVWVTAGPDAGTLQASVDSAAPRALPLFTRWSRGLHLPWLYWIDDELEPGPHRLELVLSEARDARATGATARIHAFVVNAPR